MAEQLCPLGTELPLPYRAPHEFRDDRALILVAEGLVERSLHVIRNTKINGRHGVSIVETFNNCTIRFVKGWSIATSVNF
ncbi:MAG TPA: hypothetical protein VKP66_13380 [Steroidobacteraceae bacterium]|nr:hypothetical protein [Steroidobacteraceae bacterium]